MNKPSYQNFVDQLSKGNQYGVFVDDTGSPGLQTKRLHPERKSWVGVVVPPHSMPEVLQQMPEAIALMQEKFGVNEFHFSDILSGRKEFKDVDWEERMGIFRFMSYIFSQYRFPIYVQTLAPDTLSDWHTKLGSVRKELDKLNIFDFNKPEDAALFFLLFHRLRNHIKNERNSEHIKARVFVDEGYKPNGCVIQSKIFESEFADGMVCFASSNTIIPIQLADFAAFCLNRSQLLLEKRDKNRRDIQLLSVLSQIAPLYRNIQKFTVNFN